MNRSTIVALSFGLLTAIGVTAYAATAANKPGPEQKKLEAFVGTWTYVGEAKDNPFGPAGKITGTDVYEMLPGGFFLQHRWEEKNPLGPVHGTEIWGYDPIKKAYTYNYFTSLGEMGSGTFTISGNTWNFAGSGITYEGKTAHGRASLIVAGSSAFTVKAEASPDGKKFAPAFEGKWTRKN